MPSYCTAPGCPPEYRKHDPLSACGWCGYDPLHPERTIEPPPRIGNVPRVGEFVYCRPQSRVEKVEAVEINTRHGRGVATRGKYQNTWAYREVYPCAGPARGGELDARRR